jgi:hypothetical protein
VSVTSNIRDIIFSIFQATAYPSMA